ncbi:MAG: DUF134 domain-containing protein [Candidatus Omnitrophica bacterium]|nr:DUF134 domain-containing protein [Candidatus Omnitrophota bacterium]
MHGAPGTNYFKPRGIPMTELEAVCLGMDEFEAIRLADLEGLYQEDAAKKMSVSRQTFGNIIESAHKKIAEAIVNGKALKIEGGVVEMIQRRFTCSDCKHEWSIPCGTARSEECPKCQSKNLHPAEGERGWARRSQGLGSGRCRRRS